jgi:hypothetical protein
MATLITNQGIVRVDDNALMHWAKGSEAKNHKWIKRFWTGKGWRYEYKQASNKAKNLGDKISREEGNAERHHQESEDWARSARLNIIKANRVADHAPYDVIFKGKDINHYKREQKRVENYVNNAHSDRIASKWAKENEQKAIRAKEDAKRQQASALAAAQRAEAKSPKAKAKKVIKKLSNALKNPVTTTGTITTSDNKKITKTIKKKKKKNLSGGTFRDFETKKKLHIN